MTILSGIDSEEGLSIMHRKFLDNQRLSIHKHVSKISMDKYDV